MQGGYYQAKLNASTDGQEREWLITSPVNTLPKEVTVGEGPTWTQRKERGHAFLPGRTWLSERENAVVQLDCRMLPFSERKWCIIQHGLGFAAVTNITRYLGLSILISIFRSGYILPASYLC